MKRCPICNKKMEHTTKPTVYRYKGESTTIEQPGLYCDACEESFLSKQDLEATKKEAADFIRKKSMDNNLILC